MSGADHDAYVPCRRARFERVVLRGLPHRIARWGPQDADPVLLLHGFLDTGESFQFLVDEFADHWHFVALDWRGFGDSVHVGAPYWFPDYLADLDALIDLLSPSRPLRLVGHSMGGNVAALYAGVRPNRVRSLVSLEGFGLPRAQTHTAPQRYANWLDQLHRVRAPNRYESLQQFSAVLLRRNSRLNKARADFLARAWSRDSAAGGVELRADPWHWLVNPQLYRREEAEACWAAFAGPVLMLLAEHSEIGARLGADASEAAFRNCFQQLTMLTIAGVGHMMHHEEPALVAAAIRPFLESESPCQKN